MPLIYGEGRAKAYARILREIPEEMKELDGMVYASEDDMH
jgi:hypothetical protein